MIMALKVALQMDPIGSVNIHADSTFRIAIEAQSRGHELFFYTADRLAFVEGRVVARGFPIELRRATMSLMDPRLKSISPIMTSSGCVRTRRSIWAISPRRICST
jgi:glutathione synthase/RimK-type ligase-like ATP-grasp enzyme